MQPIEIIVILACVLIVGGVLTAMIVRKVKGKSGCCGCDCKHCASACGSKPDKKRKESADHDCCHTNKLS